MNPAFDPTDWIDVITYAILSVPATVTAFAAYRAAQKAHSEVKNGHPSNIREDIDDIRESLKTGFARVDSQLEGIRQELRTERLERIEGDMLRMRG